MKQGYFSFVLHGHLPWVLSHGRWPHGTDWLCEAASETYLPIIQVIEELVEEGYAPKLTMGLSPVLCEQLADDEFRKDFRSYLELRIKAAQQDAEEFYRFDQKNMLATAQYWEKWYQDTLDRFVNIDMDIIGEFRKLQDGGFMEIITCGATHGYYPLLSRDESLQAQTRMAVKNYEKHFGKRPKGIWLPECAYRPRYEWSPPVAIEEEKKAFLRKGADEFMSESGLEFFFIDSPLLKGGKSIGVYIERFDALKMLWERFESSYHPREEEFDKTPREAYLVSSAPEGKKPVAVYTRDPDTGLLVWSGEHGYPGDGCYLDFHKKRFPGGLQYWAVTSSDSDLGDKVEYVREAALGRVHENAEHFASKVTELLEEYHRNSGRAGILTAPYDAELFGHWWFEGPLFLKQVLKRLCESDHVELTFLADDLKQRSPERVISIPEGSWGQGNHHYIWLNENNEWTWKHIYESELWMHRLAAQWKAEPEHRSDKLEEILKQAARELMLMSASDWQFLISTFAARDYAELRLSNHYSDFCKLAQMAESLIEGYSLTRGDEELLAKTRERDCLFEEIEIEWFAGVEYPA